jgi:tRNA (guanosine-2'-O-)-methyltransferase
MENTLRQDKIEKVLNNRQEGIMVFEDIHDPHNFAASCRSAEGFGLGKVWLIFEKEKSFNPKKVGKTSSSSANKWLDFRIFKATKQCLKELRKEGFEIWATVLDPEAIRINEADFTKEKIVVMFGNEHRGLSEVAVKGADKKVYIPMKGMVQSFNLSVTAAIFLYEIDRQREKRRARLGNE